MECCWAALLILVMDVLQSSYPAAVYLAICWKCGLAAAVGKRLRFKEIYRDNLPCDSAQPGDTVSVVGNGGREGDRVFKIFDAPLMEAARASFNDFITKPLHFQVTAKLGQPLHIRAFDDDGYQAEYVSEYIVSAANTSISDMTSVRVQLGRLGGTGYSLGE